MRVALCCLPSLLSFYKKCFRVYFHILSISFSPLSNSRVLSNPSTRLSTPQRNGRLGKMNNVTHSILFLCLLFHILHFFHYYYFFYAVLCSELCFPLTWNTQKTECCYSFRFDSVSDFPFFSIPFSLHDLNFLQFFFFPISSHRIPRRINAVTLFILFSYPIFHFFSIPFSHHYQISLKLFQPRHSKQALPSLRKNPKKERVIHKSLAVDYTFVVLFM